MARSRSSANQLNIIEKDSVIVLNDDVNDSQNVIRIFQLSLNNVTVELCSLGASITRIHLPLNTIDLTGYDDVVLGFDSVKEMYETQNSFYFGVCTGRVSNRIRRGQFKTEQNGDVYQLAINNEPNHLHGGDRGFSRKIWEVETEQHFESSNSVRFFYVSDDGDQGYPGKVKVSATYSLESTPSTHVVKLQLSLAAELLDDKPSPINVTQHTYFNLAGHDNPNGILDHTLRLYCSEYTPVDDISIPTRELQSVAEDSVMDWRCRRTLLNALKEYGNKKSGRSMEQVHTDLSQRDITLPVDVQPYGFDHNYVVIGQSQNTNDLSLVAVLQYANRRLTIRSTQPGVQLYTANYLDGSSPTSIKSTKQEMGSTRYHRWQGLCLETQHFPDSILVDEDVYPLFAKGKCPILTPESRCYQHLIEYSFENDTSNVSEVLSSTGFHGTDSDGKHYNSVEEMWNDQGVAKTSSDSDGGSPKEWYERAKMYYQENCSSTIDGVLGGFASITESDIQGSIKFMHDLQLIRPEIIEWSSTNTKTSTSQRKKGQKRRACECGAGIGRVSKGLLLNLGGIDQCDLIEASATLLSEAPNYLGNVEAARCRFFCIGLQDWYPLPQTYTIIWIQWVLSYLTDDDIVRFLRLCGESLVEDGVIVLKENTCGGELDFEVDNDDASVTRSLRYWKYLIAKAGLRIIYEKLQDGFPDEIYPVPMLALEVCSRVALSQHKKYGV
jgi:galactose mutarotase-like enzyme/SAM-dependent methyltransferase